MNIPLVRDAPDSSGRTGLTSQSTLPSRPATPRRRTLTLRPTLRPPLLQTRPRTPSCSRSPTRPPVVTSQERLRLLPKVSFTRAENESTGAEYFHGIVLKKNELAYLPSYIVASQLDNKTFSSTKSKCTGLESAYGAVPRKEPTCRRKNVAVRPETIDIFKEDPNKFSCLSAYSNPTSTFRLPRVTSTLPLEKTAAKILVKALENSICPSKGSSFTNKPSEKSTNVLTKNKVMNRISEESTYLTTEIVKSNNNPQTSKEIMTGASNNVHISPPLLEGDIVRSDVAGDVVEEAPGYSFLNLVREESLRLYEMAELADKVLSEEQYVPEETQEKLRTVSGQAKLLVNQKMKQFEGLCLRNIKQETIDDYSMTSQDLAGFWDVVKLQIDHVDRQFMEIEYFEQNYTWEPCDTNEFQDSVPPDLDQPNTDISDGERSHLSLSEQNSFQQKSSTGDATEGVGSRKNPYSDMDRELYKGGNPQFCNIRSDRFQSNKQSTITSNEHKIPNESSRQSVKVNSKSFSGSTETRRNFMKFK